MPLPGLKEPAFQLHAQTAPAAASKAYPILCPPQSAALSNAHLTTLPILPGPGPTPPCSLGPPDTGAVGGWWGEALKAGDCLGELGDRAPIVPAPEPPQWSSLAQRGFDNGQDISMQSQPLIPLPVPQPRGGGWGAAGSEKDRGWGRTETEETFTHRGSPGGTAQESGEGDLTRAPKPATSRRGLSKQRKPQGQEGGGGAIGDQTPWSLADL